MKFTEVDMNATQFSDVLYGAFPKLANGGGFQSFRAVLKACSCSNLNKCSDIHCPSKI